MTVTIYSFGLIASSLFLSCSDIMTLLLRRAFCSRLSLVCPRRALFKILFVPLIAIDGFIASETAVDLASV